MKVLVTGSAGFIGSHLVERLLRDGYEVTGVDSEYPNEMRQDQPYRFILRDLREKAACRFATRGIDRVYHLAADMGGIGYITKDHARIAHDNSLIDLNMLQASVDAGVTRFWYAGSACAYPSFLQRFGSNPLIESDAIPADPEPGYGWAKLYGEQLCRYFGEETRMQTRVTRFFNIYGPGAAFEGDREKALMALCRKIALAKDGDEIAVWGDGQQIRDFTYVSDAVDAVLRVMDSDIVGPVNIGNGEGITVSGLVDLIARVAGKKILKKFDMSKPQGVRVRIADNSVLRSLGWVPRVSLEEGIRRSYGWVQDQLKVTA